MRLRGTAWPSGGTVGSLVEVSAALGALQGPREADEQEGLGGGQERKYREQPGRPRVVTRQRLMADLR
jgi:hypothetical protein